MKCGLGIAGVKTSWGVIAMGQRIVRAAEQMEELAGEPYTARCNLAWRLMTLGERVEALGKALEARADLWARRAGYDMEALLARAHRVSAGPMIMSKSFTLLILSSLLLSACASREQVAARKAEAERAAEAQRDARCASFGYKVGTPDYSRCLENLYIQDQQTAAAEKAEDAARVQRVGNALQQAGAAMQSISPPPPPIEPMHRPITCNTFGTTTTCF